MIDAFSSANVVDPGAFTPPTERLKSVSPVKISVSFTRKLSMPAVCPGVWSPSIRRPPTSSTSPGSIASSTSISLSASKGCARISTPSRSW